MTALKPEILARYPPKSRVCRVLEFAVVPAKRAERARAGIHNHRLLRGVAREQQSTRTRATGIMGPGVLGAQLRA